MRFLSPVMVKRKRTPGCLRMFPECLLTCSAIDPFTSFVFPTSCADCDAVLPPWDEVSEHTFIFILWDTFCLDEIIVVFDDHFVIIKISRSM